MKNIIALLFILICISCKNQPDSTTNNTESMVESEKQYMLTPFSASTEFNDAQLSLSSFSDGMWDFEVTSDDYVLGAQTPDADSKMCANSDQGQHIHLILGTDPYVAKYEADFQYDVDDREAYMLAFLSRSYHESIKSPSARVAAKINIENNAITSQEEITGPMIFYSRPKGTYVGKAQTEKVMLDFYLLNTDLTGGNKVIADINGEEHTIDTWQPYYIEGLPMGSNTIKLTLVDSNGEVVDVPGNPVTREFELQEDPTESIEQ